MVDVIIDLIRAREKEQIKRTQFYGCMKKLLPLVFLFSAGLLQAQSFDSLKIKWESYTLPNGIRVMLLPDNLQPEVSVEFWIGTGAADEQKGQYGFAHFFEHATPYGLRKDSLAMKALRASMTNSNAQTRKDYTRYYIQVKPDGLDLALRYAAERMNADTALITPAVAEAHRKNVLNEMKRQEGNVLYGPTATGSRAVASFGEGHPYGHSTYGSFEENEKFSAADVQQWYAAHFTNSNLFLFVSGHFDPSAIKPAILREIGGIRRPGRAHQVKATWKSVPAQRITVTAPVADHFISLTWPVAGYASNDVAALQLLAYVLDERLASAGMASVKTECSELFGAYRLGGQFGIGASFKQVKDSLSIEQGLHAALDKLIQEGPSEQEVKAAFRKAVQTLSTYEKTLGFAESRTELLGEGLLFANDPDHYLRLIKMQGNLRPRDLQQAARKWLKKTPGRVLVIASKPATS